MTATRQEALALSIRYYGLAKLPTTLDMDSDPSWKIPATAEQVIETAKLFSKFLTQGN